MLEVRERARYRLVGVMLALATVILSPQPVAQEVRVRKSIDALTAEELKTYIHAVKKIQEKSATDPTVPFSYAHMAGLHNLPDLFDGACEHWNHRFLAWHRAFLLNYEDALRASDPPRTSKVTIPYWDWTLEPSGKRYPVAFENDAAAVAAHYGSPIDPAILKVLFKPSRNNSPSGPMYPWSVIAAIAGAAGSEAFLGSELDHGTLENPPHDEMHGFIGGDLVLTSTAANDPVFWSFHTFIDLVWWWRQNLIADPIPCGDCSLRGMPASTATGSDGPTKVSDVTDSPDQLDVTYDFGPIAPAMLAGSSSPPPSGSTPPSGSQSATPAVMVGASNSQRLSAQLPWHAEKALETPDVLRQFEMELPLADDPVFGIELLEVQIPTSLAYLALVFVHPTDVPFVQGSVDFRDRYLVGHFGQWSNSHAPHMPNAPTTRHFSVDVDRALYPGLALESGSLLTVSVAIYVMATSDAELRSAMAAGAQIAETEANATIQRETAIGKVVGAVR